MPGIVSRFHSYFGAVKTRSAAYTASIRFYMVIKAQVAGLQDL